jgi:hypothetical protein
VEPPLLARALRGLPRILLLTVLTEPHSTKQREDCVGWGLETDAETPIAPSSHHGSRHEERARTARPHRLPGARHPRKRRCRAPCASGARLRLANGTPRSSRVGHLPTRATRSRSTCCSATSSSPVDRRGAGCAAGPARRALYVLPDRARHAQRDAQGTSCASSIPTSRSIGWPSTPDGGLEARGERIHPASASRE